MKILLINNNTQHLKHLHQALAGHEVEEVLYEPGVIFNYADKDLIVLSGGGGEGLEIDDRVPGGRLWYHDQIEFIKGCNKPILGICMGFEVIARAFGSPVKHMSGGLVEGFIDIKTTSLGRSLLSKASLKQWEAHEWHVKDVDAEQLEVLATSLTGIEVIRHRTRPILATQFHPEKGGTIQLQQLTSALFS